MSTKSQTPATKTSAARRCKNCVHWNNKQRELNYLDGVGFCLGDHTFNIRNGRSIGVIDLQNLRDRSAITGNPSHDLESILPCSKIKSSRYILATDEDFGCVMHESKLP